jgi:glutathione synthase/RimK-type ligase-like ATP-grasp enzyme
MRLAIIPYKSSSNSSKLLSQRFTELNNGRRVFRIARDSTTYRFNYRRPTVFVNWGCSISPEWMRYPRAVINEFGQCLIAGNKLLTFQQLQDQAGINIPEFTYERAIAANWTNAVVVRNTLTGHSGVGISLNASGENLPTAPLYVKYIPKRKEFRVHVIFGQVVDVQQKKKRQGFENANFQVRNHANGWVYCRENLEEPTGLREAALRSVEVLGLDFGAVDIIWNEKQNRCYVLEVNTAPGLEGSSVNIYADAIWRKLHEA